MSKRDDFSWEKGRVTSSETLGKIVSIPVHDDSDTETEEIKAEKRISDAEEQADIIVDEFKEKMAEILSKELRKKQ